MNNNTNNTKTNNQSKKKNKNKKNPDLSWRDFMKQPTNLLGLDLEKGIKKEMIEKEK